MPRALKGLWVTALLLCAIAIGAGIGLYSPALGAHLSTGIDPTLVMLLGLLFFEVRFQAIGAAFANLRFIGIAWVANFLIVPLIGYALASLFLSGQPLLYTGLMLYFLAPCTDWFLGFTRMARGDTALGAALLPINMITQLMLYPVWLFVLTRSTGVVELATISEVLLQWFLVPFIAAQVARVALGRALPNALFDRLRNGVGVAIPVMTAALILQIFATNASTIADHADAFSLIVVAVFLFFATTFLVGESLTRLFALDYPQHALLAITTAARNAPLMLALTTVAIPGQPLVYAALVIGMLVEFPHLTALKHILITQFVRRKQPNEAEQST
ncbi:MAG: arsenic resistance protein [Pseudomonadota bacterium]